MLDAAIETLPSIAEIPPPSLNLSPPMKMASVSLMLIRVIVKMYDDAIWTMRDVIREIEKYRQDPVDFGHLHDLARHAIHTSEVVAVAVDTVTELVSRTNVMSEETSPPSSSSSHVASESQFWLSLLQNIHRRSRAIEKRFDNEIQLAFNLVAQRDSVVIKEMSQAMQQDSAAMKTIALVTLAFLPSTLVSTIFSTSFFDLTKDPSTDQQIWYVSDRFWIYWAIAVPLTILTWILWVSAQRRGRHEQKQFWPQRRQNFSATKSANQS